MKKFAFSSILFFVLISTSVAQWQKINNLPVWTTGSCLDAIGDSLAIICLTQNHILITTDAGASWTAKTMPESQIASASDISLINKNTFYIASGSGAFYKTTDGGNNWTTINPGSNRCSFANYIEMFDASNGIAMGDADNSSPLTPVILKTINGNDWAEICQQAIGGTSSNAWRLIDFVNPNVGYYFELGVNPRQLYKTINGGSAWTVLPNYTSSNTDIIRFYDENFGLVTRNSIIYRTVDGGAAWQTINFPIDIAFVGDIEFVPGSPSKVWAGTRYGLFYSADSGKTWLQQNNIERTFDLAFPTPQTGWMLTQLDGLYYTKSGGLITNVAQEKNLPTNFQLFQNYPNPFNPETTIKFHLSELAFVTLKVYDLLGKEVATLINEFQQPGIHNSTFNINNYSLPSGTYFYRLTAGDYSSTQKMVLLK